MHTLFNTFGELEKDYTVFGLDTHMEPAINGIFVNTLKIPFQKLDRKESDSSDISHS